MRDKSERPTVELQTHSKDCATFQFGVHDPFRLRAGPVQNPCRPRASTVQAPCRHRAGTAKKRAGPLLRYQNSLGIIG